jgi:hypothetical protein
MKFSLRSSAGFCWQAHRGERLDGQHFMKDGAPVLVSRVTSAHEI